MNWGPVFFGLVVLGLLLLVIVAVRRMAAKKATDRGAIGEAEAEEPLLAEEDPSAQSEGAAGEDEDEDEDEIDEGAPPESGEDVEAGVAAAQVSVDETHDRRRSSKPGATRGEKDGRSSPAVAGSATGGAPPMREKKKSRRERTEAERSVERERLTHGLAKTRGGFIARLGSLFRSKADLDAEMLEQMEEILFTADIGTTTSQELIDGIRRELSKTEIKRVETVWQHIKQHSAEILRLEEAGSLDLSRAKPFVILVVGVNGTGKTTTIGKLAARFQEEGLKVILAAGDTFRAAATEQLEVWGKRASCPVVKGKEGADPSSVIVDALKHAQETGADMVIADTAGRLHTKVDLMEEIRKVRRSISKRVEGAPHETFLVLDSTMGQNAIAQAKMFKEAANITGLILTKLDGTAKGGVVLGICNELKLPVRFVGIGEGIEDLREFDPEAFVDALYLGADTRSST